MAPRATSPPPRRPCALAAPAAPAATPAALRLWPAAGLLLAAAALSCCPPASAAPASAPAAPAPGAAPAASAAADASDYDYQNSGRFDEYPVVVPKRTAMLLDRIMTELQQAMGEGGAAGASAGSSPVKAPLADLRGTMDLQRRGQQKGSRVYWRCYFNAVTCFRRK